VRASTHGDAHNGGDFGWGKKRAGIAGRRSGCRGRRGGSDDEDDGDDCAEDVFRVHVGASFAAMAQQTHISDSSAKSGEILHQAYEVSKKSLCRA
jgi:hypothetical protein